MSERPEHLNNVRRWLQYAQEDLETAVVLLKRDDIVPRHVCWLAQQGAEKAIKAALIFVAIDFPRQHDLDALRNRLPADWLIKQQFPDLAELTEWAVESRYPGEWPEAMMNDAKLAVEQACGVFESIWSDLRQRDFA